MSRPDARTRERMSALIAEPSRTVVVTDFDGTLSPIVDDPTTARPLDGVVEVLGRLATTVATVAVVSGRPASFLIDRLGTATHDDAGLRAIRLFGLYGMESVGPDGSVRLVEEATTWLPVITEVASNLRAHVPPGVLVEVKGAAATVHWRLAPGAEGQVSEQVAELVDALKPCAPVAVCLDTCHVHVAGYDIVSEDGYIETMKLVEATVGVEAVKVWHCNDAKAAFGSKLDRHEHIGEGTIGAAAFRRLLHDERFAHCAFIAETPVDAPGDEARNVGVLRTLAAG